MPPEEKAKPHDIEVRMAVMEAYKEQSLRHHDELKEEFKGLMSKLDEILIALNSKQCTLHSARMLQLDQDLTKIEKAQEKIWEKLDSINIRIASIAGGIAFAAFILNRIF